MTESNGENQAEYRFRGAVGGGRRLDPADLECLRYEKQPELALATVTLARPEKLNAINIRMRDEIDAVVADLELDEETKVVVIKGEGRSFCGGYDLAEIQSWNWTGKRTDPNVTRRTIRMSQERWMRLWNVRQVTIAQVHGYCLVGGVDLIAVCDLVFASEDAQFGQPQARRQGLIHTLGMYPIYIGPRKAKEYAFTGEGIPAAEAERLGLVNHVYPAEQLEAEVLAYAKKLADIPGYMLYAQKDAVNRWFETAGMRAAMHTVDDLDAIVLAGAGNFEFGEKVASGGDLKAALRERDAAFGDFNARPRD